MEVDIQNLRNWIKDKKTLTKVSRRDFTKFKEVEFLIQFLGQLGGQLQFQKQENLKLKTKLKEKKQ